MLNNEIDKLSRIGLRLSGLVGNITFNYEEQELIRRVLKSVFCQINGERDKETAKSILGKTRWVEGN